MISVSKGIEHLKKGNPIIIFDENNELEGDMVIPADIITVDYLNFMLNECKGIICQTLHKTIIEKLKIPIFTKKGVSLTGQTNFIYPVDQVQIDTGISSLDRLKIIKELINKDAQEKNIVIPGHQNLLKISDGGIMTRQGHTESSSEMVSLAGYTRSAVICEIIDNQGVPMRLEGIKKFSEQHSIPVVFLGDIYTYFLHKKAIYISPPLPFCKNPYKILNGKKAIITGGSSGIGLACKTLLETHNCTVYDFSKSKGFDVTDYNLINNEIGKMDEVDFLIYSAGYIDPKKICDMSVQEWTKHIDINLTGAFNVMRSTIPKFKDGGIIINVSSPCAHKTRYGWSAYCSSKAGLHSLTQNASAEFKELGIKVFGVSPSKTDTPMIHRLFPKLNKNDLLQPVNIATLIVNIICNEHRKVSANREIIYRISKSPFPL